MNESQEETFKIKIPMFEPGEFERIDKELNNIDILSEIVRRVTENVVKEKEQVLSQLIMSKQQKEIERLNNIIEKLEIDIEIGTGKYTYDTDYNRGLSDAFIYMEDRIKELKGSDKE